MTKTKLLRFSKSDLYYESNAHFENEKGQSFIINVKGREQATVEQCNANLCAYLEVSSDELIELPQVASFAALEENEQPFSSEGTLLQAGTIEPQSTQIVEVAFKINKIEDTRQPIRLNFRVNDILSVPIDGGGRQLTKEFDLGTQPIVWVKVSQGIVNFVLVQKTGDVTSTSDNKTIESSDKITYLKTPNTVSANTQFYVRVTGIGPVNKYEIGGTRIIAVSRADVTPLTPVR